MIQVKTLYQFVVKCKLKLCESKLYNGKSDQCKVNTQQVYKAKADETYFEGKWKMVIFILLKATILKFSNHCLCVVLVL